MTVYKIARRAHGVEVPVDLAAIGHVYARQPLTDAVVAALNPDATLAALVADLDRIGFPYVSG